MITQRLSLILLIIAIGGSTQALPVFGKAPLGAYKYLSADARIVIGIDVKRFRRVSLYGHLTKMLKKQRRFKVLSELLSSTSNRVDHVLLTVNRRKQPLLVLRGAFMDKAVADGIKKHARELIENLPDTTLSKLQIDVRSIGKSYIIAGHKSVIAKFAATFTPQLPTWISKSLLHTPRRALVLAWKRRPGSIASKYQAFTLVASLGSRLNLTIAARFQKEADAIAGKATFDRRLNKMKDSRLLKLLRFTRVLNALKLSRNQRDLAIHASLSLKNAKHLIRFLPRVWWIP